jgi:hypothetical protein
MGMKKPKRKSKSVRRVKLQKKGGKTAWSKAADVLNRVFGSWADKPAQAPATREAGKRKSRKKVSFKLNKR